MKWLVMWRGRAYLLEPSLVQARQLEEAHMSYAPSELTDWLQKLEPLNISCPLVLHGSHKVILL